MIYHQPNTEAPLESMDLAPSPPDDPKVLVRWLESQPGDVKEEHFRTLFEQLLMKASQPRHVSGNACIELYYFIEQCTRSRCGEIQAEARSQRTCLELFEFYLKYTERNQHRSMRQVLELLASLISSHPDQSIASSVRVLVLERLLSVIIHQAAQPLVKPAFKCLECLLAKRTVSAEELSTVFCSQNRLAANKSMFHVTSDNLLWDSLISEIFDWMQFPDVSPSSGKFLVTLFTQLKNSSTASDHTFLWQRWIRLGLIRVPNALENVKNYLLAPLFKLDRSGSLVFLGDLNNSEEASDSLEIGMDPQSLLKLAAMEVGKKSGLVEESRTIQLPNAARPKSGCIVLREEMIRSLFTYASNTVRSLAFSVLVSSSSSVRPFSPDALHILKQNMSTLYADIDAKFRNDVLSNTKHMIERKRGATGSLAREIDNLHSHPANHADKFRNLGKEKLLDNNIVSLQDHESFIEWYLQFLLDELIPTASYQRHITSLKALSILLRSGILEEGRERPQEQTSTTWPFHIQFFEPISMRLLLDLLMDPFEDVRASSTSVLKLAPAESFMVERKLEPLGLLQDFIARAEDLSSRTGRADYADAVARAYEILYGVSNSAESRLDLFGGILDELELKIEIAEGDLGRAVLKAPVHGKFAALNLMWSSFDTGRASLDQSSQDGNAVQDGWDSVQSRMLNCCSWTWEVVKDILCNDSPEGHLPQAFDEIETVDTKDVLSYSFRAIHESSNLMRTIVTKDKSVLRHQAFASIGDLAFRQLSTLRHRGSFSTVSLTFTRCCQLSRYHHVNGQRGTEVSLVEKWYQGALSCIAEQVSTTRRSAGIPAIITGILSCNPEKPAFNDVMGELKMLARQPVQLSQKDETNLPQVYAMNSLKEIFKSSTLGRRPEGHIADCLELAADSLESDIWAIRNCGLLLLRSLIDCLFGTSESKEAIEKGWNVGSIRLDYNQYPGLPELLLKLLNHETCEIQAPVIGSVESVFPALDIIRRAGPPPILQRDIEKAVTKNLGSKIWHVRELAARTTCNLMLHDAWYESLQDLVQKSVQNSNSIHGVLMTIKYVLERRNALHMLVDDLQVAGLLGLLEKHLPVYRCPEIRAAYLAIHTSAIKIALSKIDVTPKSPHASGSAKSLERDVDQGDDSLVKAPNEFHFRFSSESALLCNEKALHAVFTAAQQGDVNLLGEVLKHALKTNTDIALTALECLHDAWQHHKSAQTLQRVSEVYITVIRTSQSSELRSVALVGLAGLLDELYDLIGHSDSDLSSQLEQLGPTLQNGPRSPQLSNAEIRISGCILAFRFAQSKMIPDNALNRSLEEWGWMLRNAGHANNDFDTRYAAVVSLASFFKILICNLENPPICLVESLLGLYDTLNDDDEEIRDVAAEIVSSQLKVSLVPLAASKAFLKWLKEVYGPSALLQYHAICQMTGSMGRQTSAADTIELDPAANQLSQALKDDDALFVEEEQNLFIDEVREARLWSAFFQECASCDDHKVKDGGVVSALAGWTIDGLSALIKLCEKKDGPIGWTSKPPVFACCLRILICANTLLGLGEDTSTPPEAGASGFKTHALNVETTTKVCTHIGEFLALAPEKHIHPILLAEILGRPEFTMVGHKSKAVALTQRPKSTTTTTTAYLHCCARLQKNKVSIKTNKSIRKQTALQSSSPLSHS